MGLFCLIQKDYLPICKVNFVHEEYFIDKIKLTPYFLNFLKIILYCMLRLYDQEAIKEANDLVSHTILRNNA